MKLSLVLWKGLQETLERVDKLEAEIIELKKPKTRTRKTATTEN